MKRNHNRKRMWIVIGGIGVIGVICAAGLTGYSIGFKQGFEEGGHQGGLRGYEYAQCEFEGGSIAESYPPQCYDEAGKSHTAPR